ncbi:hypothetical protein BDV35DRAFT_369752 [Aspergillus flavus]|uniref:Uncharacterized protein n=1 Tax=Aspergillus flavus TaxID=5059 RepID=A0A5N6GI22_ASPFL|nr:hypothetical protein BDV35DRAFT_369752 [Aspergillus flavus]
MFSSTRSSSQLRRGYCRYYRFTVAYWCSHVFGVDMLQLYSVAITLGACSSH